MHEDCMLHVHTTEQYMSDMSARAARDSLELTTRPGRMSARCGENFREEFAISNFSLECRNSKSFVQFQWGWPRLYLVWRCLGALFTVSLVGVSIDLNGYYSNGEENRRKWIIYLTNWDLLLLMTSSLVDLSTTVYVHIRHQDIAKGLCREMPWYLKLTWVLYNASQPTALLVSALYWFLLYKPGHSFTGYHILPFLSHGTNSIYVVINVLVTAVPTRVLHFTHILMVGILYIIFTAIYAAAGGTNVEDKHYIYSQLDWSKSGRTVLISLGVIFAAILMHLLVFGMSLIRKQMTTPCRKTTTTVIMNSPKIYRKVREENATVQGEYHC